jgi:hypothetical protein
MTQENHTESLDQDCTNNRDWVEKHEDRFIAWEMFVRYCKGLSRTPMKQSILCDKIGLSKRYIYSILLKIKDQYGKS